MDCRLMAHGSHGPAVKAARTFALAIIVAIVPVSAAVADRKPKPSGTPTADAGVQDNGFWLTNSNKTDGAPGSDAQPGAAANAPAAPVAGTAACQAAAQVTGEFVDHDFCTDDEPTGPSLADVQKAFAELNLPAGTLVIQPPDGLTLVNLKTSS